MKAQSLQPRLLRYRNGSKIYILPFVALSGLLCLFWIIRLFSFGPKVLVEEYFNELIISALFIGSTCLFYYFWMKVKFNKSVQVYPEYLLIHSGKQKSEVHYCDIETITALYWSIFYIKLKNGQKYYFSSSYERVDYIWEGLYQARADLITKDKFEDFKTKLIQHDHHQKRKEWFLKHKTLDLVTWCLLPVLFIGFAYIIQSKDIIIHHQGIYFFRLFMFSLMVLLMTSFVFSSFLKKFIFDKKVNHSEKIRNLEFEGMVIQRSKFIHFVTASFILAMLIKSDINFYSVSKVKFDMAYFNIKKGSTLIIDNRFNCLNCKYNITDGDYVVFGRGTIGQVFAKEGEMVGQIAQDQSGREIASENVQPVPKGHVAIRASNGKDILFIKVDELIGKIQK